MKSQRQAEFISKCWSTYCFGNIQTNRKARAEVCPWQRTAKVTHTPFVSLASNFHTQRVLMSVLDLLFIL